MTSGREASCLRTLVSPLCSMSDVVNAPTVVSVPSLLPWLPGPVEFCRPPQRRVKRSHQPACPQPTFCASRPRTKHKPTSLNPGVLFVASAIRQELHRETSHAGGACWATVRHAFSLSTPRSPLLDSLTLGSPNGTVLIFSVVRRCGNEFFHADPSLVTASSLYPFVYFRSSSLPGFHCPVSVVQHTSTFQVRFGQTHACPTWPEADRHPSSKEDPLLSYPDSLARVANPRADLDLTCCDIPHQTTTRRHPPGSAGAVRQTPTISTQSPRRRDFPFPSSG